MMHSLESISICEQQRCARLRDAGARFHAAQGRWPVLERVEWRARCAGYLETILGGKVDPRTAQPKPERRVYELCGYWRNLARPIYATCYVGDDA